jgi:anaerobic selenocysteine-containing dehydrogenase
MVVDLYRKPVLQYRLGPPMLTAQTAGDKYTVRGYCALCTAHCATITTVENGRVVRLDPDPDHPNGGVICVKGKAAPELL